VNRWVFRRDRKVSRDGADVTCCGRPFHTRAAATGNDLSPTVDSRNFHARIWYIHVLRFSNGQWIKPKLACLNKIYFKKSVWNSGAPALWPPKLCTPFPPYCNTAACVELRHVRRWLGTTQSLYCSIVHFSNQDCHFPLTGLLFWSYTRYGRSPKANFWKLFKQDILQAKCPTNSIKSTGYDFKQTEFSPVSKHVH